MDVGTFVGNGFPAAVLLVLIGAATLFALLAMILGLAAIIRINNSKGELRGRWMAACALVLGLLWMMGLPLLFLVAGAAPTTVNSRIIAPAPMPVRVIAPPRNPRTSVQVAPAALPDPETETDVIEPVEREAPATPAAPKAAAPAPAPSTKSQEF